MQAFQFRQFFSGLSRRVLLWLLLIALVPMMVISWISYQSAQQQLFEDSSRYLADLAQTHIEDVRHNFERLMVDLNNEAERESNSLFLKLLMEDFRDSGQDAKSYTRSFRYAQLVEEQTADLRTFWGAYGYHDILMVDLQGNVLFSFSQESDLGDNLFHGQLANTRLAETAEYVLGSGDSAFSDLERYAPSKNRVAGFVMALLLDEFGEKQGLIVFQLSPSQLSKLQGEHIRFGSTGRRYMVGQDLKLRTPDALGDAYSILESRVVTENTRRWKEMGIGEGEGMVDHTQIYPGPNGEMVVGTHATLDISGVKWCYIVEIDVAEAQSTSNKLAQLTWVLIIVTTFMVLLIALPMTRSIVRPVVQISEGLSRVSQGDYQQLEIQASHELKALVNGFNEMILNLQISEQRGSSQHWMQEGANQLMDKMQGEQGQSDLARNIITFLCKYLEAQIGAFYLVKGAQIKLTGSYAFRARKGFRNEFVMGEGMVGQAALEQQSLTFSQIPEDYIAVGSGLGETLPNTVTVIPMVWNSRVVALLEFGCITPFNQQQEQFIDSVAPSIAVAVQTSLSRDRTQELLLETQEQSEQLQVREEELRASNESLVAQADELRHSEELLRSSQAELEEKNEKLQVQQEELRVANDDLEHKALDLKRSRDQIENKNRELEYAQKALEERARELTASSKYKSEFLANMSHELRTPLNSLLILSKMLADNKRDNLDAQQIEYAQTIHESGSDLLNLINDILDLSKIESGKMELSVDTIQLQDFVRSIKRKFLPVAEERGIGFEVELDDAPQLWRSDTQKLEQIIKNLLSNALKFTSKGGVKLHIGSVDASQQLQRSALLPEEAFALSVIDTGIGIPQEKLDSIFEAFQQVDGSTSRKYGGTGLGLSISLELARMLGGEIQLESEEGQGSRFTLYIPRDLEAHGQGGETQAEAHLLTEVSELSETAVTAPETETVEVDQEVVIPLPSSFEIQDDRKEISVDDRTILIIEDDARFTAILVEVARARGFKVLVAADGETGLHFADYYQPSGIVLDIGLPGMDGWQVMERLKDGSSTRHIPVHFMSGHELDGDVLKQGAVGFLHKPITMEQMESAFNRIEHIIDRPVKRLLVVEDDATQQQSIRDLIGNGDVTTLYVPTGEAARQALQQDDYDCIVLDLGLPDINGIELLERIRVEEKLEDTPVVVYTGRDLEPKERSILERYAQSIIIKDARSTERLLDDTTLFLHRIESNLSEERQRTIRMLHDRESLFEQRKVLLVDDDMRNIFAISAALEEKQMDVLVANNGVEALEQLEQHPDVAIVLMDIMMPEMDGYEAISRIRKQPQFAELPIIALTAKAMKGDRAACIEVGASDYMGKPVVVDKLLSMMRVWLYR